MKHWFAAAALAATAAGAHAQTLDEALDAPARAHVINEYARRLTAQHVDAVRAKAAADDIRLRLGRGEYDQQTTARALATRVTRDVTAIMGDKHTYLEYVPYELTDERQRPAAAAQIADNYGFGRFETLGDNIGYLQITRFAQLDRGAGEAAARFMTQAADCAALIIDLRDANGDGQAMAALISSYLLVDKRSYIFADKQIHLHDQLDREGRVVTEFWTSAEVPGKRYGGKKPLYLLVNERTSGAAEAFVFDLQQYVKRAVVVGAPTAGDARVSAKQRVSRHLQTSLAITRASNFLTRTNWEGAGVQPDRMAAPDDALNAAQALALATLKPKK
ncbi:hypothetical protein GTP45_05980 [Pseudoduganella sp. FT55W]|uniref:Tail specific protease domain-containing protein n=1 Tax=Duganella rivi TaxID=2666083 RepID=A0A7X4KAM3_9BURK|nr:S41 family peptidase [Duganella rivi]MYM66384.1 hypothetical protein [Duganella rivi]